MAADLIELGVRQIGGVHVVVAEPLFQVDDVPLQDPPHRRAPRQPQGQPLADLLHRGEELQLPPQLAVIPPFGLLQAGQIRVERFLGGKRDPVDALEHLPVLVPPPVRAGGAEQLDRLDPAGGRQMGTPAHVLEPVLAVEAHRIVGNPLEQFGLVCFPAALERPNRVVPPDGDPLDRLVALRQLAHPRLDRLQILGRKRPADVEVIVEPVLDRRTDRQFGLREQLPHGLRKQVRGAVPVDLPPGRVAKRQPLHRGIALERGGEIARRPVDPSGQDVAAARLRRERRERRPARIPPRRSIRELHRHLFHPGPPAPREIQTPPPAWDGGRRGSTHLPPSPGGTRRALSGAPGRHGHRLRLRGGLRPGTRAGLSA